MTRKRPRRTPQRILETSLDLFNRFGEPNASTGMISAELNISPGNLYYHFPSKDDIINTLFKQFSAGLEPLLGAATDVQDVEDAWFFLHSLFELIWQYRFLYRDQGHLLSDNRLLEKELPVLLMAKKKALQTVIKHLRSTNAASAADAPDETLAANMLVLITYWLSYEYVMNPRQALEPENAQTALLHGAGHAMGLLLPYLGRSEQTHLNRLLDEYRVNN